MIRFWCEELTTEDWFRQSHLLDDAIRQAFGALHARAAAGELSGWTHEKERGPREAKGVMKHIEL